MSDNIAGYIDKSYTKGQYYKYAASPKPVIYTGDIDSVSDDLLTKAMFVTRGQVVGTLPNNFGDSFLIETVRYGNDTYLQTAYLIQTGYDCWEYRRIYSNNQWTDWIGVDSQIKAVDDKIQSVKDTADGCNTSIQEINNQMLSLDAGFRNLSSSLGGVSGQINSLSGRIQTVENKTLRMGATLLYEGNLTSGSWNMASGYSNYAMYLVVGMVRNNGARVSQMHAKGQVTENDIKYQITDDSEYVRYKLKHEGNNLVLTFDYRSATYEGGGRILQVWGIN